MSDTKTQQRLIKIKRNIKIKLESEIMRLHAIQRQSEKKAQTITTLQMYIAEYEKKIFNDNLRNTQHLINHQAFIRQLGNAMNKEQTHQEELLEKKNKILHVIQQHRQHIEHIEEAIDREMKMMRDIKDTQREQIELDQWNQQKQLNNKPLP
ncbi:hypothetical protein FOG18_13255 [Legionella israelensis]|uniref:hypothetical protein n=1 Tax=Legionella israelensis TaxID=454 RepID=UPI00117FD21A|nr:hypothetical protein [Legionella israelensis]QDP73462.1 hypothetical protein FOG18_13255 [Legionella israelensis]